MPYFITDKNADCSGWSVVDDAGEAYGCHTTKQDAIDQAIAISLSDDEPFEGERAAVGSLAVDDYVSWDVLDPEIVAQVVAVEKDVAVVRIFEEDDGIFTSTDKLMIMNVFKLEKIPAPSMLAVEMEDPEPVDPAVDPMVEQDSVRAEGDPIVIVDIDGTIVQSGRLVQRVWDFVQSLDGAVFIVTGRPESDRSNTVDQLAGLDVTYSRLIMNPGSTADSVAYKKQTAEKLLETYDVTAAIENNPDAVRAYRSLGIETFTPSNIPDQPEDRALNVPAPAYMRAAARRGLRYYDEGLGGDGLVPATIREAREMAEGRVSDNKWVRISAWIARHLPDLDAPKNSNESDPEYPGAGLVAHLLWGSGPTKRQALRAKDFADSVVARLEAEGERKTMTETVENRKKWLNAAWAIKSAVEGGTPEARDLGKAEKRVHVTNLEVREDGDGMTFEGYAAVFNSDSEPLPFIERIEPGAFRKSLQSRNEIKLLWNHDAGEPLASVRGGTLKLWEDEVGLRAWARIANTQRGRDTAELIRSGTVDSMSFGFNVIKDSWSDDGSVRTLEQVRVFEISLVSFPAYTATAGTVSVREQRNIDPDKLADSLARLEYGEQLDADQAELIKSVVDKLTDTPEPAPDNGLDLLELQQLKLKLLEKGLAL